MFWHQVNALFTFLGPLLLLVLLILIALEVVAYTGWGIKWVQRLLKRSHKRSS